MISEIKAKASGRWLEIVSAIGGVSANALAGQHGPCPRCGGKDRFRAFDDFPSTGGTICNQCGTHTDGIATVSWLLGCDVSAACHRLADHLGLGRRQKPSREASDDERHLRDRIYRAILNKLGKWPLKPEHVEALTRRGLSEEAIARRSYVSLDSKDGVVAKWLDDALKAGHIEGLETTSFDDLTKIVPGLMRDGVPRFPQLSGILIPVRDTEGLIVALKIRLDEDSDRKKGDGNKRSKYLYFSASGKQREERQKRDGVEYPKADAAVHVPLGTPSTVNVVRITEGELKADITTELSGITTISIPGVGLWERALPVLKAIAAKRVLIALDADHKENSAVAKALAGLARQCVAGGFEVAIEVWDIDDGKGIDDLLAAGHQPTVLESDAVEKYLTEHVDPVAKTSASKAKTATLNGASCESVDDPHRLSRALLEQRFTVDGISTLRRWRGDWHRWDGARYAMLGSDDLPADLTRHIKQEFDREIAAIFATWKPKEGEEPPKARKVTRSLVSNVTQALESLSHVSSDIDQPSWLGSDAAPIDPRFTFPTANCLLDLKALIRGEAKHVPPTPLFFSSRAVSYVFDPQSGCPEWLKFLRSIWSKDTESACLLQEWFGYCLTNDTSQHKFLLMVGPKRSGKSTIGEMLTEMMGQANVASPTLGSLAGRFGLEPLLGKSLAIAGDARLSGRVDTVAVVERLLSIVGEDRQDIDRKNKSSLTAIHLPLRFMILTNEVPSLTDAAGAIVGRALVLRMTRSFFGVEDLGLKDRLLAELPGILNWSIAGWQRLQARGRFEQPESARELLDDLSRQASPIGEFVEDCCDVGAEFSVHINDLFTAWKKWCEEHGRDHSSTEANFCKQLRAVVSCLNRHRPRGAGRRLYSYSGIGLKTGVLAHQATSF